MLKSKIDLLVLSEDRNRDISRSFEELVKNLEKNQPQTMIFKSFFWNRTHTVGPPKEYIFLTTFYGLYFSHHHTLHITNCLLGL